MRILFWSPNYAPEPTGIPPLVTDAADWLAERGHDVEVVTAVPNYPERVIQRGYLGVRSCVERRNGVTVHRSWLRVRPRETIADKAVYEASFAVSSLPAALRRIGRADIHVCVVPSLAAAAVAGIVRRLRGGPRLVVWLQDLVLVAAAALDGDGQIPRAVAPARVLERAAFRAADRIVACSPGFHRYVTTLGVDPGLVATVHNWVDADWIHPAPPREELACSRFLYAGNLGYTQGFETLLGAAVELDGEADIQIVGEGNAATHVRRLAAGAPNVRVRSPVPRADFPALLASADCHLVLQRRIGAEANFPSKIASYLASGRPIIASMPNDSPAAEILRASGAAVLVPPEEPARLAAAMEELHRDRELRVELGRRARDFALRAFDREAALSRLEEEIVG